jgi:hypothetical protein
MVVVVVKQLWPRLLLLPRWAALSDPTWREAPALPIGLWRLETGAPAVLLGSKTRQPLLEAVIVSMFLPLNPHFSYCEANGKRRWRCSYLACPYKIQFSSTNLRLSVGQMWAWKSCANFLACQRVGGRPKQKPKIPWCIWTLVILLFYKNSKIIFLYLKNVCM